MHAPHRSTDQHRSYQGFLTPAGSSASPQRMVVKRLKAFVYAALLAVLVVVFIARAGIAAPPPTFKGVIYDGKPFFVHGVNMPWIRWGCDFGSACNIHETEGEIRKAFQDFRATNLNVVRWWLFPGNPVTYPDYGGNVVTLVDGAGKPVDFHPDVYADIEYVLNLAREYDLKLNFTIYSSHMDLPASWKENPEHRQALADLLGRLAGRFANRPEVFAWELFNEPEAGLGNPEDSNPYARNIKELTRLVIAAQRQALAGASPRALINLGPDRVKPAHFEFWKSLDVDFWSPHFYDNMTGETSALATTADEIRARHGITQPILLGELYLGRGTPPPNNFVPSSVNLDPLARYEDVLARGYAGAWGWAYRPQNDRLTVDLAAAKAFADRYPDLIGPRGNAGGTPPASAPVATPIPTAPPPAAPTAPPPVAPTTPPPAMPTTPPVSPEQPQVPAQSTPIFVDGLAPGWSAGQSWSGSAQPVDGAGVNGSAGVRFTCDTGWCGLRFTPATGSILNQGTKISFQYRSDGASTGITYKVFVNGATGMHVLGYITTGGEWQQAVFELNTPGVSLHELVLQEHHGLGANTIVVDNLVIGDGGAVVAPPPVEQPPVELPPAPEQPVELPPAPEQPVELPPAPEQPVELPPVSEQPPVELPPVSEQPPVELPPAAPVQHDLFTDSLSPEWLDQSWSGFSANVAGGPDGSGAYQFGCQAGWCAVRFVHPTGVALAPGSRLNFSHRRDGDLDATYKVWVVDNSDTMHVLGYITPGPDWGNASFDLGAIASVRWVVLQEHHGTSGGIMLLDNLRLS